MDDGFGVQVLRSKKAGAGYLCWYFADCKGVFQAAREPQICRLRKYFACYHDVLSSIVEIYAKQGLLLLSGIAESKKAAKASKVFMEELEALESSTRVYSWAVPAGFFPA